MSVAESPGRTERAGAARYGIAGASLVSGIDNLNEVLHGKKGVGQALTDTAVNTAVGGLSAVSSEALARRLGSGAASTGTDLRNGFAAAKAGFKAGAGVDAVTGGLFSTWDNAAAYRSGRETAGQATAKVLSDSSAMYGLSPGFVARGQRTHLSTLEESTMCPSDEQPDDQEPRLLSVAPSCEPPNPADQRQAATAQLVRERLLNDGVVLSPQSAAEILALGEAAVEPLVLVMVDCRLRDPKGPAAGWAPVHAAQLLGQLSDARSVEPLLDVLATTSQLSPLRVTVEKALAPMGARLIAPILARLPTAVDAYRWQLWSLLANAKVRDQRIFIQLLGALAESPEQGAMYLAEYGDPAALPELSRAMDAYKISLTDDGDHPLFELREAIQELGGMLTAAQQAKYEQALLACRIKVSAEMEVQRSRAVSPVSPCPCGSGRRYQHCCLQ